MLISESKAQYVSIPDSNFRKFLIQNYSTCMSGNLLDTTCVLITNEDTLNLVNLELESIDGIRYFQESEGPNVWL